MTRDVEVPRSSGVRTRVLTWASVVSSMVALVLTVTRFQPIAVPLVLATVGLIVAVAARRSGLRQADAYDGRLSLASFLLALGLMLYLGVMQYVVLLGP